jgi:hypothetical protein
MTGRAGPAADRDGPAGHSDRYTASGTLTELTAQRR